MNPACSDASSAYRSRPTHLITYSGLLFAVNVGSCSGRGCLVQRLGCAAGREGAADAVIKMILVPVINSSRRLTCLGYDTGQGGLITPAIDRVYPSTACWYILSIDWKLNAFHRLFNNRWKMHPDFFFLKYSMIIHSLEIFYRHYQTRDRAPNTVSN